MGRDRGLRAVLSLTLGMTLLAAACGGDAEVSPSGTPNATTARPSNTRPTESSPVAGPSTTGTSSVTTTAQTEASMPDGTPITVTIGATVLEGTLRDSPTARDLIAQLPLALEFEDHNSLEKIARLPQKLTMDGVPKGDDPEPNDIGYYAPTGDLVLYYDDVGYFDGIVRLGVFTSDMDPIRTQAGTFTATIQLAG